MTDAKDESSLLSSEDKELLKGIRKRMKITKVVATRTVKGRQGDSFVGFAAAFDTVQEEGGRGLIHVGDEEEATAQGTSLKEARLAALLLGMQADLAAHAHAYAGSNITGEQFEAASRGIKNNYALLLAEALHGNGNKED